MNISHSLHWHEASTIQLYQIATEEPVPLELKYAAARELQRRDGRFKDWMIEEIFRLFPRHDNADIAAMLNVNYRVLNLKCHELGLRRSEVY